MASPRYDTSHMIIYHIIPPLHPVTNSLGPGKYDLCTCNVTINAIHHTNLFQLKGYPKSKVKGEIDRYITSLALEDKRHVRSKNLSGGMKRKLSVGIALIGDSKVGIYHLTYSDLRISLWIMKRSQW